MFGMGGGELAFAIAVGLGLGDVAALIRVHLAEVLFHHRCVWRYQTAFGVMAPVTSMSRNLRAIVIGKISRFRAEQHVLSVALTHGQWISVALFSKFLIAVADDAAGLSSGLVTR